MNRRDFLKLSTSGAAMAVLAACVPQEPPSMPGAVKPTAAPDDSPMLTQTEDWPVQALHRITYGPTPAEVSHFNQIGWAAFLDEQLNPENLDDRQVEKRLKSLDTLNMDVSQLRKIEPRNKPNLELSEAVILRGMYSSRQLFELVVDFWSNHFNMNAGKNLLRFLKTIDDREVVRPNALGTFRDLLGAMAHSPAMLVYLDNAVSTKQSPNENYARELLELHTLGVDGGYTQQDVQEVARVLTGWSVAGKGETHPGSFAFHADAHDDGEKVVLGQTFPAGQGIQDGEQLLDLLAGHPSTANFISRKLVRRFVSDTPPESLVSRAAEKFTQTQGDIREVLREILLSDEFRASLGGKFKRPLEFVVSMLRVSGAQIDDAVFLVRSLAGMGQPLFYWPTPDGFPDTSDSWMGTGSLLMRWNLAVILGAGALKGVRVDWTSLTLKSADLGDELDGLSQQFLGNPLPQNARAQILEFGGAFPEEWQVPVMSALLLASPLFQYR